MSANSLYIAYEDYLIGRVPSLSTYYFYGSDPGGANEKVALQLIKYAIEKLLNWTVDTAVKRFDEYIIFGCAWFSAFLLLFKIFN